MLSSGINKGTSSNVDSLLSVLSDGKKAAETLKKIKAEQVKLQKLKKEVAEGKTLAAYKNKIEKETTELLESAEEKLASFQKEEKALIASSKKETMQAKKAIKALEIKETSLVEQEKEIIELRLLAETLEEKAIKQQEKADKELKYALSLKEEYDNKLTDIKERLKGL